MATEKLWPQYHNCFNSFILDKKKIFLLIIPEHTTTIIMAKKGTIDEKDKNNETPRTGYKITDAVIVVFEYFTDKAAQSRTNFFLVVFLLVSVAFAMLYVNENRSADKRVATAIKDTEDRCDKRAAQLEHEKTVLLAERDSLRKDYLTLNEKYTADSKKWNGEIQKLYERIISNSSKSR